MNPKLLDRIALKMAGGALVAFMALAVPSATLGQAQGAITPNYKDADLGQIIEAVSAVTGKNFIVDPRVRAQVTMLSSTPMSPNAFYEAFLSILQVHGFVAVPSGDVIKIIPDANARQVPANDLPSSVQLDLRRDRHAGHRGQERERRAAGADPAAADSAVRPPRRLPGLEHADHLGSRLEREPHGPHRPAHRPAGRREHRRHPDAARERRRGRAHRQHALHQRGRRGRRHADRQDGRRRPDEQRAGERRGFAATAPEGADHAPRHAPRGGRRHAGALPALRGRREDLAEAARADAGDRCRRARRRRRSTGRRERRRRGQERHHLGRAADQCAGGDRATQGDALDHVHRRPAGHPPRAGAGRGDPRRDGRRQGDGSRHQLGRRRHRFRGQHRCPRPGSSTRSTARASARSSRAS